MVTVRETAFRVTREMLAPSRLTRLQTRAKNKPFWKTSLPCSGRRSKGLRPLSWGRPRPATEQGAHATRPEAEAATQSSRLPSPADPGMAPEASAGIFLCQSPTGPGGPAPAVGRHWALRSRASHEKPGVRCAGRCPGRESVREVSERKVGNGTGNPWLHRGRLREPGDVERKHLSVSSLSLKGLQRKAFYKFQGIAQASQGFLCKSGHYDPKSTCPQRR